MERDFYTHFENSHRGSRELIKIRGTVFLPFILPLRELEKTPQALDLGCGRGEWLELVREQGFAEKGIDLNQDMLQYGRDLNLKVEQSDVLSYLEGQEKENLSLVTAFHVIEYIPFEQLLKWAAEIYRILKPGGILILETPNPDNLVVGTSNFYLDPTHIRPIPPELLIFTLKFIGFERIKVIYLHEEENMKLEDIDLNKVLGGVSPDYAVVAQKQAKDELLTKFNEAFNQESGVSLTTLANQYDQRVEGRLNATEMRVNEVLKQLAQQVNKLQSKQNIEELLNASELRINKVLKELANQINKLQRNQSVELVEKTNYLREIQASSSWKLTKPLREMKEILTKLKNTIRKRP